MSPKDSLILFIKGFILGVANIIPGVSGGTLAVSLGIYEKVLDTIGNLFKKFRENMNFLFPIILGIGIAFITTSKLVSFALSNYKAQTIFLFVGLIFGGTSLLMRKTRGKENISNMLVFLTTFIIVIALNFIKTDTLVISFDNMGLIDYFILTLMGFIASSAMVIPGISGSFVLMIFGYYEKIINTVSNLTNLNEFVKNMMILIPFGIGVLIGIIFMAKLITILIKKYEVKTYFGIIGFVLSSIVILILQITDFKFSFINILTCIIAFLWGYTLARVIEKE